MLVGELMPEGLFAQKFTDLNWGGQPGTTHLTDWE